jgi:hypothetical protein
VIHEEDLTGATREIRTLTQGGARGIKG